MTLEIGDVAPGFSLPTMGGVASGGVTLDGRTTLVGLLARGKLALAFYPKDNTSG
jgi:peroxiredoxin